jgi:hypothetical protein
MPRALKRYYAHQNEARLLEKSAELIERPLAAAGVHQHVEVRQPRIGVSSRIHNSLDEHQRGAASHCFAAAAQDTDCLGVLPIVEHILEQIGVAASRYRVKETAACNPGAPIDPRSCKDSLSSGSDMRQIEKCSCRLWVFTQDAGEERPVAAADIDEMSKATKVDAFNENRNQRS